MLTTSSRGMADGASHGPPGTPVPGDARAFPVPAAARLRRPGARDPRLLGGILLVAVAVALGSRVVSQAAVTVPALVAAETLVPGDPVHADALRVREVRLDDALVGAYLLVPPGSEPADVMDPGAVVLRSIGAGELVPRSALGEARSVDLRPVAVTPSTRLGSDVRAGSLVDLWFVPAVRSGDPDATAAPPRRLADALTVAEVDDAGGAFAMGGAVTVHVLVPQERLADVLAATALDGSLTLVAVPGSAP